MMDDEPMLRYFAHSHLPDGPVRDMSALFAALAERVVTALPRSAERSKALNDLKIAKDWAVFAAVDQARGTDPRIGAPRAGIDSPDLKE